jgi:transposase-like protein
MSNKRYYSPEFKRETLEMLAIGDHTIAGLERTLGITAGLVRQWKRKAQRNGEYVSPNGEPKTDKEAAARICELEKGNAWLRQEREILKKAMAITSTLLSWQVMAAFSPFHITSAGSVPTTGWRCRGQRR